MTNEELEQKVKRLEEELTEVRIALLENKADKKPYEVEVPDDLEDFYFVDETGLIESIHVYDEDNQERVYKRGLAFKTRKEAQQHDKERILLFKLHKWAEERNGDWYPNWKDFNEAKYFIIYDKLYETFKIDCYGRIRPFSKLPCFKSEEIIKQFIEEFGDEIKEVLY